MINGPENSGNFSNPDPLPELPVTLGDTLRLYNAIEHRRNQGPIFFREQRGDPFRLDVDYTPQGLAYDQGTEIARMTLAAFNPPGYKPLWLYHIFQQPGDETTTKIKTSVPKDFKYLSYPERALQDSQILGDHLPETFTSDGKIITTDMRDPSLSRVYQLIRAIESTNN